MSQLRDSFAFMKDTVVLVPSPAQNRLNSLEMLKQMLLACNNEASGSEMLQNIGKALNNVSVSLPSDRSRRILFKALEEIIEEIDETRCRTRSPSPRKPQPYRTAEKRPA